MTSAAAEPRRYVRPYVVAERLDLLHGPTSGHVLLPRHLDWSRRGSYDLDSPGRVIDLYPTVLNEAASPGDLYAHLDEATLKRLWSYLWLPAAARRAWEERFPQLAELSRLAAAV